MYEYAITAGEGTLIEFGVMEWRLFVALSEMLETYISGVENGQTLIIAPCDDDCETGK